MPAKYARPVSRICHALGLPSWSAGCSVQLEELHQDDDPVRNLDKTLREEEPDTIDGAASVEADPEPVIRKRGTAMGKRTKDVENLTAEVESCAEKMLAAAAGKPLEFATTRWAKKTEKPIGMHAA